MKKKLLFKIASYTLALIVIAFPAGVSAAGTLKVGVRSGIVGFGDYNETTGKYYGLEIDLAAKLADELGYSDVEYITVHAETREESLTSGEVDCLLALFTITEERAEKVDFSPAYYTDYTKLIVEESSCYTSLNDLKGKKIGIHEGSDAVGALTEKLVSAGVAASTQAAQKAVEFVEMDNYSNMSNALETGDVDAILMDGCIASSYMKDDRVFLDETVKEIQYGVATQKGSELSAKMADAVQKLLDDGTIDSLIDKWN